VRTCFVIRGGTENVITGGWTLSAPPHVGERTEKQLIAAFCDKIAELSPQLVTFNGNSLAARVALPGDDPRCTAPGLSLRPYFNRYTEDAIDLCDALSSFSPHRARSIRTGCGCERHGIGSAI